MVRNVVLSNINNKIARLHVAISSLLINYFVIKKVKAGSSTRSTVLATAEMMNTLEPNKPRHLDICIHHASIFLVLFCQR